MFTDHNWASVDGKRVAIKIPGDPGFKTLSVEDLWTIPLEHMDGTGPVSPEDRPKYRSLKPIRLVIGPSGGKDIDLGSKLQEAFGLYELVASRNRVLSKWYQPKTRLDKFRFNLHKTLLRWGVIV